MRLATQFLLRPAQLLSVTAARVLFLGKWLLLAGPMAAVVGTACAAFLWALDRATLARLAHPGLIWALPAAGAAIAWAYARFGRGAEGGNNLILEQIHEPGGGVPLRMAPLILLSTVLTHLFGGSVGREGTAVQLGGSVAGGVGQLLRLSPRDVRVLLTAGVAAGFGAVFGTPVAGAVFALEVLAVGRVEYGALLPAIGAAIVGDWTCHAWGIEHVAYHVAFGSVGGFGIDPLLMGKVVLAAACFGLAGYAFSEGVHGVGSLFKRLCPSSVLRPVLGGAGVIGLTFVAGTTAFLGLGVSSPDPAAPSILAFFGPAHFATAWLWKIAFTILSLGAGFKGGEVTPLFFIGAGLGNALSGPLGAPTDLFAALGFVAIFAAASNTPLACTIMGVELFGAANTPYVAVACCVAFLCSGHSGIYLSQRVAVPKSGAGHIPPETALRHARALAAPLPVFRFRSHTQREFPTMAHHIRQSEIGMVRIYVKPKDRSVPEGGGRLRAAFGGRPLFQELVNRAKAAGLVNAVAHHTHYGFSNGGATHGHEVEGMNADLTMCVELIGKRAALEGFCRAQGALLAGKVIVYKHLEHWEIGAGLELREEQVAEREELREGT